MPNCIIHDWQEPVVLDKYKVLFMLEVNTMDYYDMLSEIFCIAVSDCEKSLIALPNDHFARLDFEC